MPTDDPDDPAIEWDESAPTYLDAVPVELAPEESTPTVDPITLPGYEIGKRAGRAMGYQQAISDLSAVLAAGAVPAQKIDQLADLMRRRARAVPER